MSPVLPIAGWLYVTFLVVGVAFSWYRERRFPVWALLPAGALAWVATYVLGIWVASLAGPFSPLGNQWQVVVLINAAVAVIVSAAILHDYCRPAFAWLAVGLVFVGGFLSLMVVAPASFRSGSGGLATALGGLAIPVEALMLVAVGLLAARRYGVLALLVVLGGFAYMLADSDYLWGYRLRDWAGLRLYVTAMTLLFLVVAPVGFLRARTHTARAAALFLPVGVFCVARLVVPWLVLGRGVAIPPGDVLISLIIPLSLVLGWWLFGRIYDSHARKTSLDQAQMVGLLS